MSQEEQKEDILKKLKDPKVKIKIYMYAFIFVLALILLFLSGSPKDSTKNKISLVKTGEKMVESGEKMVEKTSMFVKSNEDIQNVMKKTNEVKDEIVSELNKDNSSLEKGIDKGELSDFLQKMKEERDNSLSKIEDNGINLIDVKPEQIEKDEELLDVEAKYKEGFLPPMRDQWKEEKYKKLAEEHQIKIEEEKKQKEEEKIKQEENSWDNFMKRKANDDFLKEITSEEVELKNDIKKDENLEFLPPKRNVLSDDKRQNEDNNEKEIIIESKEKTESKVDKKFEQMFKDLY